jgi:hypothetical protein
MKTNPKNQKKPLVQHADLAKAGMIVLIYDPMISTADQYEAAKVLAPRVMGNLGATNIVKPTI